MRSAALLAWTVAATSAPLAAVEYALPERPLAVGAEDIGGRAVAWVDWGAAGASRARDPDLIGAERDGLERWLASPEVATRFVQLSLLAEAKEDELLRTGLAEWHEEYARREQPTAFPSLVGRRRDVVPLPVWAYGLPPDIRASTQVLIFDDRDPAQRAWVLDQGRAGERMTFAYCTGWRSGQDRDDFWHDHPGVPIHPIATDRFAVFYGVTAYPARIRFAAETMDVEQGLDP
jgi:hypothetical protein